MVSKETKQIILSMIKSYQKTGKIIDDHTKQKFDYEVIGFCAIKNEYGERIGLMINASLYCINETYFDKERVLHLGKNSVGGIIKDNNIETYKEEYEANEIYPFYLKDYHSGMFETLEDFDQFMNSDKTLII